MQVTKLLPVNGHSLARPHFVVQVPHSCTLILGEKRLSEVRDGWLLNEAQIDLGKMWKDVYTTLLRMTNNRSTIFVCNLFHTDQGTKESLGPRASEAMHLLTSLS